MYHIFNLFLNSSKLLWIFLLATISDCTFVDNANCGENRSLVPFKHDNFIVQFNPYMVSSKHIHILETEDFVPLIEKITAEFSNLVFKIQNDPYKLQHRAVSAVAKYNLLLSSSSLTSFKPISAYMLFSHSQIYSAEKLANEVNHIYQGTIKFFVISWLHFTSRYWSEEEFSEYQYLVLNNMPRLNFKFGILMRIRICEQINSTRQYFAKYLTHFSLLVFTEEFGEAAYSLGAEITFEKLIKKIEMCRHVMKSFNLTANIALQTSWHLNPLNGQRNYSALVSFWEKVAGWSLACNTMVFMDGAFDSPISLPPQYNGWWKFVENIKRYYVPKDFEFQDKRPKICRLNDEIKLPEDNDFKHYNFITMFTLQFALGKSATYSFTVTDNMKIISILATKFVAFLLIVRDIKETSLSLAVANYNKFYRNVSNNLQMNMYVHDYIKVAEEEEGDKELLQRKQIESIFDIAEKANSIFPGTIRYVILRTLDKLDTGKRIMKILDSFLYYNKNLTFKLGLFFPLEDCLHSDNFRKNLELLRNIHLFIPAIGVENEDLSTGLDRTVKGFFTAFQRCQEILQINNVSAEFALATGINEYDAIQGVKNYSSLVSFWSKVNFRSKRGNTKVIMKEAFDVIGNEPKENYGWWNLAMKPRRYQGPEDYIYEDKLDQTKRVYNGELPSLNIDRIQISNATIKKNPYLCVYFSPLLRKEDKWDTYNEKELVPILRQVAKSFSSIYASPIKTVNGRRVSPIPTALAMLNKKETKTEPLRLYLEFTSSKYQTENNGIDVKIPDGLELAEAAKALEPATEIIFVGALTEYEIPYDHDDSNPTWSLREIKAVLESKKNDYKQGALFPIRRCGFGNIPPYFTEHDNPKSFLDLVIFELHPEEEDFEIGVQQTIKWFKIVFQRCKDKMEKVYNFTQVAFMTSWPEMNLYSGDDVESLIIFWERMTAWAEESNTTVIIKEAFDIPNAEKKDELRGWWRLLPNENYVSSSDYIFEEKREAYLRRLSNSAIAEPKQGESIINTLFLAVILGVVILVFAVVIILLIIRNKKRTYLSEEEINEFLKGNAEDTYAPFKSYYDSEKYELFLNEFSVKEKEVLGSGEFGKVYRGSVKIGDEKKVEVAVKTTKRPCPKSALNGILSEIKILQYLGRNPHIVEMIGAYTSELNRGKVFIFLEMCSGGSLEKHLRRCKAQIEAENQEGVGINLAGVEKLLGNDLCRWAIEIGRGLEFITVKKIVHMDIATRNVLLTDGNVAKISDFGLSRRLQNYEMYIKSGQEPLPWRWMSPESLLQSEFTEKTDVWAFGVTLWEIFTLGDLPYGGLSYDPNFGECLRRGIRLGIPTYSKQNISLVMGRCWALNPENRPTFSELRIALENAEDLSMQMEDGEETEVVAKITEYDIID